MQQTLVDVLVEVQSRAGKNFSGVGIIVCDDPDSLPLFPIRLANDRIYSKLLVDELTEICLAQSEYHDGFHIISSNFGLTSISQYFSPPIVKDVKIDRTKRFGGRYLAALFGSALPTVDFIGIASNGFGVAIFEQGAEVYYRPTI
jgi:hypothetical protein